MMHGDDMDNLDDIREVMSNHINKSNQMSQPKPNQNDEFNSNSNNTSFGVLSRVPSMFNSEFRTPSSNYTPTALTDQNSNDQNNGAEQQNCSPPIVPPKTLPASATSFPYRPHGGYIPSPIVIDSSETSKKTCMSLPDPNPSSNSTTQYLSNNTPMPFVNSTGFNYSSFQTSNTFSAPNSMPNGFANFSDLAKQSQVENDSPTSTTNAFPSNPLNKDPFLTSSAAPCSDSIHSQRTNPGNPILNSTLDEYGPPSMSPSMMAAQRHQTSAPPPNDYISDPLMSTLDKSRFITSAPHFSTLNNTSSRCPDFSIPSSSKQQTSLVDDIFLDNDQTSSQDETRSLSGQKPSNTPRRMGDRIPKRKKSPSLYRSRLNLEECNFFTALEKFRALERDIKSGNTKVEKLENQINDKLRKNPGQNLDLDKSFINAKKDLAGTQRAIRDQREKLKKIKDHIGAKYNLKIHTTLNSKIQNPRASMSTTPIVDRQADYRKIDDENKDDVLELGDALCYCRHCDVEMSSLGEYCEHLQDSQHARTVQKKNLNKKPWTKQKKVLKNMDSVIAMRSIVRRVADEFGKLTTNELSKMLDPKNEIRDDSNENHPLRRIRGYDFLTPMKGFYCALCDRAVCDVEEVEQHVRSYEHVIMHTRYLAIHPHDTVAFNNQNNKRMTNGAESPRKKSATSTATAVVMASTSTASTTSYKKATSRIVDEHESIRDKFDKPASSKQVGDKPKTAVRSALTSRDLIRQSRDNYRATDYESPERVPRSGDERASNSTKKSPISLREKMESSAVELVKLGDKRVQTAALKQLRPKPTTSITINDEKKKDQPRKSNNTNGSRKTYTIEDDSDDGTTHKQSNDPYEDSDDDDYNNNNSGDKTYEADDDNDVHHLNQGDSASPFPDLQLFVTGVTPKSALKDMRLKTGFKIKMNRIILENYKHMLNDSTTMMQRINLLMAKRENDEYGPSPLLDRVVRQQVQPKTTYMTPTGDLVPIGCDENNEDISDIDSTDDEELYNRAVRLNF